MIDLLMLILLVIAFSGTTGYVTFCSRLLGQSNRPSDDVQ
jgi:hypothetical protein